MATAQTRFRKYIEAKYGMTLHRYKTMRRDQKGVCAICGKRTATALRIDHDHDSGRVRGLLCVQCNTGLGQFKDDETLLRKAIKYLQRNR